MDVELELKAMQKRLERGIERNYLIGMAHVEGMDPHDYADKLDKERAIALVQASQNAMEQVGAVFRGIYDAYVKAAEGFARGWNASGK